MNKAEEMVEPAVADAQKRIAESRKALGGEATPVDVKPVEPVATEPKVPASPASPATPAEPAPTPKEELKVETPANPVEPSAPQEPVNPPQAGTPDWYKAELQRKTQELNDRDGTHGAAMQAKERELDDLKAQLNAQQDAPPKTPDDPARPAIPVATGELTAAQAREILKKAHPSIDYSEYANDDVILFALPLVESAEPKRETSNEVAELKQTVEEIKAASAYETFAASVEQAAPGFIAVNGNPAKGIDGDPAWFAYLQEPTVPGGTQSIGDWLTQHGTVESTAHYLRTFKARGTAPVAPAPPSNNPARPSPADQVAPDKVTGEPPSSGEPKVYSRAVVEKFKADIHAKTLPWDAENKALFREYGIADHEGRVR